MTSLILSQDGESSTVNCFFICPNAKLTIAIPQPVNQIFLCMTNIYGQTYPRFSMCKFYAQNVEKASPNLIKRGWR
jgi:hypothetical protein